MFLHRLREDELDLPVHAAQVLLRPGFEFLEEARIDPQGKGLSRFHDNKTDSPQRPTGRGEQTIWKPPLNAVVRTLLKSLGAMLRPVRAKHAARHDAQEHSPCLAMTGPSMAPRIRRVATATDARGYREGACRRDQSSLYPRASAFIGGCNSILSPLRFLRLCCESQITNTTSRH